MERYSEENSFPPFYMVILAVTFLVAFLNFYWMLPNEIPKNALYLVVAFFTLMFLFLLNASQIRTAVTSDRIRVRLGRVFPIFWASLPLADIQAISVVEISWLRRWNLGMHLIRFRSRMTWAVSSGSRRAVYIERTRGIRMLITSERPETLAAAIERQREKIAR